MNIGFILPGEADLLEIARAQAAIFALRQDQVDYAAHLLRSWQVFGRFDGMRLVWRAIKRVQRERP